MVRGICDKNDLNLYDETIIVNTAYGMAVPVAWLEPLFTMKSEMPVFHLLNSWGNHGKITLFKK